MPEAFRVSELFAEAKSRADALPFATATANWFVRLKPIAFRHLIRSRRADFVGG